MKKLIFLILILSLLFCGCSAEKSNVEAITSGVSFDAEITYNNETHKYSAKINNGNETALKSLSSSLPDFSLEFSGETVNISYDTLSYKTELSALPEQYKADFIHSVFLDASKEKNEVLSQNNSFFLAGDTEKYKYKIYFGLSGLPIKITESNFNITAILKNAKVL